MENQPFVSCIMPTANRKGLMTLAIEQFLQQDYPNAELIIIDDGTESSANLIPDHTKVHYFFMEHLGTIGVKRNIACEKAKGELVLHLDDDDWYAPDWISRQVDALVTSGADITGLSKIQINMLSLGLIYVFENNDKSRQWLCGATLAYRKSLWQKYHFANLQIGEDADFLINSGGKIQALDYTDGFLALFHPTNTSIKTLSHQNPYTWMGAPDPT